MGYLKVFIGALILIFAAAPLAAQAASLTDPSRCSVRSSASPNARRTTAVKKRRLKTPACRSFSSSTPMQKTVTPAEPIEGRKPTEIERMERVEGKLILQGAEDGIENVHDGLGWTAAISEATGKFILTASGEKVAFVFFGACIAQ